MRDALRKARHVPVTPEMVERALAWVAAHREHVVIVAQQPDKTMLQPILDQWMLGLLGEAMQTSPVATIVPPVEQLSLGDLALEQYTSLSGTITIHFLVKGEEVAKQAYEPIALVTGEQTFEVLARELSELQSVFTVWPGGNAERVARWRQLCVPIFGDVVGPYFDRVAV